jgi:hypothetical protein
MASTTKRGAAKHLRPLRQQAYRPIALSVIVLYNPVQAGGPKDGSSRAVFCTAGRRRSGPRCVHSWQEAGSLVPSSFACQWSITITHLFAECEPWYRAAQPGPI